MDYAIGVQIFGAFHDLFEESLGVGFGDLALLEEVVVEVAILAVLGDDVHIIRCLIDIMQLYDVLMAYHLHDIDLRLYVFQIVSIQK